MTFSTVEPAPWRPESPAQRATNSALPETRKLAVKRPPFAPAVTTCSLQRVEPRGARGHDDRLAALGAAQRAVDRDPAVAAGTACAGAAVSDSVEPSRRHRRWPVVNRLRNTPSPAAGVEVSA